MADRFEMRLSPELAAAIDVARGDVPRATWIKAAIRIRLTGSVDGDLSKSVFENQMSDAERIAGLVENAGGGEAVVAALLPEFRCKVPSCPTRAKSAAATCPLHGGKLVAI